MQKVKGPGKTSTLDVIILICLYSIEYVENKRNTHTHSRIDNVCEWLRSCSCMVRAAAAITPHSNQSSILHYHRHRAPLYALNVCWVAAEYTVMLEAVSIR